MSELRNQKLVLSHQERMAFSWVGDRYHTGWEVRKILLNGMPEEKDWYDEGDMEFSLTPGEVGMIFALSYLEDHQWPCFSAELKNKMNEFIQLPY